MTDIQPRWPAHTPIAPGGHGPGGGRWMPTHATGGGDWAERVARQLGVPGNLPGIEDVGHGADLRSDWRPGFWQAPTAAAMVERHTGGLAEDADPDLLAEARAASRARKTYVNGRIAVHVDRDPAGGPDVDVAQLLAVVDHLQTVAPIDHQISIAVADQGVQYPSILGRGELGGTITEDGVVALSRTLFSPSLRLRLGWFVGASHGTHPLTVITAHEWGHLLDTQWTEQQRRLAHEDHGGSAISRYAETDNEGYESVAEAFVDWYLSRGRPDSPDTQWYADGLGWEWQEAAA